VTRASCPCKATTKNKKAPDPHSLGVQYRQHGQDAHVTMTDTGEPPVLQALDAQL
jgi:hypothetical protein